MGKPKKHLCKRSCGCPLRKELLKLRVLALGHERRMGWGRGPADSPMLDDRFRLNPKALRALRKFKRSDPTRGFLRAARRLVRELAVAYSMTPPKVRHVGAWRGRSISSAYRWWDHEIRLRGARSILTLLFQFAASCGYGGMGATWWSVNTFRKVWPRAFAGLVNVPGTGEMVRGTIQIVPCLTCRVTRRVSGKLVTCAQCVSRVVPSERARTRKGKKKKTVSRRVRRLDLDPILPAPAPAPVNPEPVMRARPLELD